MPNTSIQPLPYPGPSDPPSAPAQMKALAEAIEKGLVMRFASIAERDAKLPSGQRVSGMFAWVDATQAYYVWSTKGTPSWKVAWWDTGWVQLSPSPEIIFIRRVGGTVTIVATGGKGIPSLGRVPIGAYNIVPAEHRPAHDMIGALELRWLTNGAGTLSVDQAGTIWVWNPTPAANGSWYGTVTYVV